MKKYRTSEVAKMMEILDTPEQDDDIISACDRLLLSLSKAEINAGKIRTMLKEMKELFLACDEGDLGHEKALSGK